MSGEVRRAELFVERVRLNYPGNFRALAEAEEALRYVKETQGLRRQPLHRVRWALSEMGHNDMDPDRIRMFINTRSDEELLALRNLGRWGLLELRAWAGGTVFWTPNWVGEGVPAQ